MDHVARYGPSIVRALKRSLIVHNSQRRFDTADGLEVAELAEALRADSGSGELERLVTRIALTKMFESKNKKKGREGRSGGGKESVLTGAGAQGVKALMGRERGESAIENAQTIYERMVTTGTQHVALGLSEEDIMRLIEPDRLAISEELAHLGGGGGAKKKGGEKGGSTPTESGPSHTAAPHHARGSSSGFAGSRRESTATEDGQPPPPPPAPAPAGPVGAKMTASADPGAADSLSLALDSHSKAIQEEGGGGLGQEKMGKTGPPSTTTNRSRTCQAVVDPWTYSTKVFVRTGGDKLTWNNVPIRGRESTRVTKADKVMAEKERLELIASGEARRRQIEEWRYESPTKRKRRIDKLAASEKVDEDVERRDRLQNSYGASAMRAWVQRRGEEMPDFLLADAEKKKKEEGTEESVA